MYSIVTCSSGIMMNKADLVSLYNFFTDSIDECLSDPCFNNGTCIDDINRFNCTCDDGYNGTLCESEYYIKLDTYE